MRSENAVKKIYVFVYVLCCIVCMCEGKTVPNVGEQQGLN